MIICFGVILELCMGSRFYLYIVVGLEGVSLFRDRLGRLIVV